MYLISPHKTQYKANLHSHSTLSDGERTPEELKDMYKSRGYSILAITDHERPCDHSRLTDKDFLMLTGYEAYIRTGADAVYDVYAPEVHLNLFARDPHNETMICYNRPYCKYIPPELHGEIRRAGSETPREYTREYINSFIRTARENGYAVGYNHPYWSMETEADILATEDFMSLEIVNYGSYNMSRLEHCGALYDKLLLAGRRVFCHAADDNHNRYPTEHPENDSFGAFTVIMADSLGYGDVFSAMEAGDMYASMGPAFKEISCDGGVLHISCSPVEAIIVYTGSKTPARLLAGRGGTVDGADIKIDPRARFVRVSIVDGEGNFADTRGYTRKEVGLE